MQESQAQSLEEIPADIVALLNRIEEVAHKTSLVGNGSGPELGHVASAMAIAVGRQVNGLKLACEDAALDIFRGLVSSETSLQRYTDAVQGLEVGLERLLNQQRILQLYITQATGK